MQKKLTVLFAFAIFVLIIGWAITPVQAHECENHRRTTHPHCNDVVEDDGSVTARIDFRVMGDISGPQCANIKIHNGTKILGTNSSPKITLDMSFFDVGSLFDGFGDECFSAIHTGDLIITENNDGTARAQFFFPALARDETTVVKSTVLMDGGFFNGPWPPNDGGITTVEFDGMSSNSWTMTVEGKGKKIACTGEGQFDTMGYVDIDVERDDSSSCQ